VIPVPTAWWAVSPDSYIADANGKVWYVRTKHWAPPIPAGATRMDARVAGIDGDDPHRATLVGPAGEEAKVELPGSKVVDLMVPTDQEAVAMIESRLGKVRILKIEPNPPPGRRNTPALRAGLALHLIHFHAVPLQPSADKGNGTLQDLIELHVLGHARPWDVRLRHVHAGWPR